MATNSSISKTDRAYHQDFIARVRYSNYLPPPPIPPKLLEIPNTGLSSGLYTSAAYASRLVKDQPINIEADAELGMPIDLVGLPGVFDGDESVIHAPERPPPVHPHDRQLLKPLSALGKPTSNANTVSFLRRTEYVTSAAAKYDNTGKEFIRSRPMKKRRLPDEKKNDPIQMLRTIIKGFDLAYPNEAYTGPDTTEQLRGAEIISEERAAWKLPQHPVDSHLKLLDIYPILPDVDAFADHIGYIMVKFTVPPVPAGDKYDDRLDVGIFQPELDETHHAQIEAQKALDSTVALNEEYYYHYFWPKKESVRGIKRKFDANDPDHDDDSLYDVESLETARPNFRYDKVRTYETTHQAVTSGNYSEVVGVALHDEDTSSKAKAAYVYPIKSRVFLKPQRKENRPPQSTHENQNVDAIDITVSDFKDEHIAEREEKIRDEYAINI